MTVETECAHCREPMRLEIDSDLNYRVEDPGCEVMAFIPEVNFGALEDPNIIDAF